MSGPDMVREAIEESLREAETPQYATHRIEFDQVGNEIIEIRQTRERRKRPQKIRQPKIAS